MCKRLCALLCAGALLLLTACVGSRAANTSAPPSPSTVQKEKDDLPSALSESPTLASPDTSDFPDIVTPSDAPDAATPSVTPSPTQAETPTPGSSPKPSPKPLPTAEAPSPSHRAATPSPKPSAEPSTSPSPPAVAAEDGITMSVKGPDGDLVSARVLPPNGLKTVYDALQAACEEAGVTFGVRGSGAFIYVETIGGFAEFDDGPLSGWIYKVNGVQVMQGIGSQTVSPGDRVSFYYTKDMGADVKSEP